VRGQSEVSETPRKIASSFADGPSDSGHHGFIDQTNQYEQIIKESMKEIEQNQLEEEMYLDSLKNTIRQANKDQEDIEQHQQQILVNQVNNDFQKSKKRGKNIPGKATMIVTKDGLQRHGKLPPLKIDGKFKKAPSKYGSSQFNSKFVS
jgi:hypothetical protein